MTWAGRAMVRTDRSSLGKVTVGLLDGRDNPLLPTGAAADHPLVTSRRSTRCCWATAVSTPQTAYGLRAVGGFVAEELTCEVNGSQTEQDERLFPETVRRQGKFWKKPPGRLSDCVFSESW